MGSLLCPRLHVMLGPTLKGTSTSTSDRPKSGQVYVVIGYQVGPFWQVIAPIRF